MARQALTSKEIDDAILVLQEMRDNIVRYLPTWYSPDGVPMRYAVGDIERLQNEINMLSALRARAAKD